MSRPPTLAAAGGDRVGAILGAYDHSFDGFPGISSLRDVDRHGHSRFAMLHTLLLRRRKRFDFPLDRLRHFGKSCAPTRDRPSSTCRPPDGSPCFPSTLPALNQQERPMRTIFAFILGIALSHRRRRLPARQPVHRPLGQAAGQLAGSRRQQPCDNRFRANPMA